MHSQVSGSDLVSVDGFASLYRRDAEQFGKRLCEIIMNSRINPRVGIARALPRFGAQLLVECGSNITHGVAYVTW